MNKERLLVLANFLDGLKPEELHMPGWGGTTECGTVACAAGWATKIKEFNDAGYVKNPRFLFLEPALLEHGMVAETGWDAIQVFFGLDRHQATHIFLDASYLQHPNWPDLLPADVSSRIRKLVEERV